MQNPQQKESICAESEDRPTQLETRRQMQLHDHIDASKRMRRFVGPWQRHHLSSKRPMWNTCSLALSLLPPPMTFWLLNMFSSKSIQEFEVLKPQQTWFHKFFELGVNKTTLTLSHNSFQVQPQLIFFVHIWCELKNKQTKKTTTIKSIILCYLPRRSPVRRCRCWGHTLCPDRCAPGCQSRSFRYRRSCSFSTRTHAPGSRSQLVHLGWMHLTCSAVPTLVLRDIKTPLWTLDN